MQCIWDENEIQNNSYNTSVNEWKVCHSAANEYWVVVYGAPEILT